MVRQRISVQVPEPPEPAGGPFAFQIASQDAVRTRRLILFTLFGIATYLLALIATLPARFLVGDAEEDGTVQASAGTVWAGEAALLNGHGVRWSWAPLDSLFNLAFTVDFTIVGPETELRGETSWRPGRLVMTDVEGTASGSLISALAPDLPFTCDFLMRVNIGSIVVRGQQQGAEGDIRSSAGSCAPRSGLGGAAPMPALVATSTITTGGSSGWIATQLDRSERLVTSSISPNGRWTLSVTPSGSALLPSGAALGEVTIEKRL